MRHYSYFEHGGHFWTMDGQKGAFWRSWCHGPHGGSVQDVSGEGLGGDDHVPSTPAGLVLKGLKGLN